MVGQQPRQQSFRLSIVNFAKVRIRKGQYMAKYLLIESRDPFESNDVGYYYELARGLVETGNEVTLFLVQNAVLAARAAAQAPAFAALLGSGVTVLADEFALKQRGITRLRDGVATAPIETVVDHLEAGHKTLWH
jgi:sulfur relay (sulfurtransferase) complex TusBCD TusD component (DsrE family)